MRILLLGHKPTENRLRPIADALRQIEKRTVGIDGYFNGHLTDLCRRPENLRSAQAIVFGLSPFSVNVGSPEYEIERHIFEVVRKSGSALFLVPDEVGPVAPYLKDSGKAVVGVLGYLPNHHHFAEEFCPAAYMLRVPVPTENATPAARLILKITRTPGYIHVEE